MTALGDADFSAPISDYLGGSDMTALGDIPLTDDIEDYAGVGGNPVEDTADMLQWYAADQETGRTDGDDIATVADWSGNGHSLTGATGPDWRNGANGIGGVPAYQFGSNREVSASGRVLPLNNFTLFMVITWTSGRPIGLENDGSGTHGLGMVSNNQWVIRRSGSNFDVSVTAVSPSVDCLRVGGGSADALKNYDGATRADLGAGGYSDASVNFTLGSSGNGGSDLSGKIAEFVSYNRKLDLDELYAILGFLRNKYGV